MSDQVLPLSCKSHKDFYDIKTKRDSLWSPSCFETGKIRTSDPQIRNLMLYPTELRSHSSE